MLFFDKKSGGIFIRYIREYVITMIIIIECYCTAFNQIFVIILNKILCLHAGYLSKSKIRTILF
jgi:hypothetical protein